MFNDILLAAQQVVSVGSFLSMTAGALVGTILGAIPGLNGTMAIALLLPVTLYVSPWVGIPMILAIYKSATWGGSIGSILLNTPGTSAAVVMTLDGYPLYKQGKGGKALHAALYSGVIGDTISDLITIFVCAPIATIALMVGPPEFMLLISLALLIIVSLGDAKPVKALMSAGLGLFFSCLGYDPIAQTPRLMFGIIELGDGIKFVPMLIGMFALSEVFYKLLSKDNTNLKSKNADTDSTKDTYTLRELWAHKFYILMGTAYGTIIGALPGIGSTVSPWLAYATAKKRSKKPEEFGKGSVEGLVSAQSACNAVSGANLVPLLTLGIPGDTVAAMLIGTMTVHGMQPGPLLMLNNKIDVYSIFVSLLICDVIYFLIGWILLRYSSYFTRIPDSILMPFIVVVCVVGSYAYSRSFFDVFVMFVFGILGYFMKTQKYSVACFMIAFILSPMLEMNLRQTLVLYDGNILGITESPVCIVLFIIAVFMAAYPMISGIIKHKKAKAADSQ